MTFQTEIEDLTKYVNQYYECDLQDGNELSTLIQKITGLLYFLETVRSSTHDLYETKVFNLVKEGASVSRAVNEANVEFPEMYQLRHIMTSDFNMKSSPLPTFQFSTILDAVFDIYCCVERRVCE